MSNFNGGNFPQRKKIALDNSKLNLQAPNAAGKMATLKFGFVNNNPRLTVWTNDPNDTTDNGKITAALNLPVFFDWLEIIKDAAMAENGFKAAIENKNYIFPGGKRSETPVVTSRLIAGKDENGLVYVSVTAHQRPNLKFVFKTDSFHSFKDAQGNEMDRAAASKYCALGFYNLMSRLYAHLAVSEFVEIQPKQGGNGGGRQGGGYGGGRGNGGNGGGGGYSGGNASGGGDDVAGEDIPW